MVRSTLRSGLGLAGEAAGVVLARAATTGGQALGAALRGPVGDELVRVIVDARLAERLVAGVLGDDTLERVIAVAAERHAALRATDAVLAIDGAEEVLEHVLASHLADSITERVLASEELHRIVGHIARSDEVRAALSAQGEGLAQDVAHELRSRTSKADDALEQRARRLLRRRERAATVALDDGAVSP